MQPLTKYLVLSFLALLAGAAHAGGSASAGNIRVTDAWARATPPGVEVGAAYFVINIRGRDDRLLGVSSPIARRAELHISTVEDGLMKMQHLDAVEVQRGEPTVFAPAGRHVMLLGLTQPLREGDTFPLTLRFEQSGPLEVPVQVRGTTGDVKHTH